MTSGGPIDLSADLSPPSRSPAADGADGLPRVESHEVFPSVSITPVPGGEGDLASSVGSFGGSEPVHFGARGAADDARGAGDAGDGGTQRGPDKTGDVAPSIGRLDEIVAGLPADRRAVVRRVFAIDARVSMDMDIPQAFRPKMSGWLSSVAPPGSPGEAWRLAVAQRVMCVTNRWLYETTHFNPLRACRPVVVGAGKSGTPAELEAEINACAGPGKCDFCSVRDLTGEEGWGRVETAHCITSSNAFKSDALHGVLILKQHHPLKAVCHEGVLDALQTMRQWFRETATAERARRRSARDSGGGSGEAAREEVKGRHRLGSVHGDFRDGEDAEPAVGPTAVLHPFFLWNCLHRSSATQIHAHGQMMLSPSPAGRVRLLRDASRSYASRFEGRDLLTDVVRAHDALGLVVRLGEAAICASITPRTGGGELLVVDLASAGGASARADVTESVSGAADFDAAVAAALVALVHGMGVRSFSMTVVFPSIGDSAGRAIARIWSRGDPTSHTADVGAPELMGFAVGTVDPYTMLPHVRAAVGASPRLRAAADARVPREVSFGSVDHGGD